MDRDPVTAFESLACLSLLKSRDETKKRLKPRKR